LSTTESVLLDTSIIVAHFRREPALADRLKAATLYIPLPVLGELTTALSSRKSRNRGDCAGTSIAAGYSGSALLADNGIESVGLVAAPAGES
jgi:predicted nucleic acid-binding protein